MASLVQQLQTEALNPSVRVADLLRKAKVAAAKLDLQEDIAWIERELNGYARVDDDAIPEYREIVGELKGYNPYRGWQNILCESQEAYARYTRRKLGQKVGELDDMVQRDKGGGYEMPYPDDVKLEIMRGMEVPLEPTLKVDRSRIVGVLDAVRSRVLDWSLRLEKLGIVGEGMSFSEREKERAHQASQVINIGNLGSLGAIGPVSGMGSVASSQMNVDAGIDVDRLLAVIEQIKAHLGGLPGDLVAPVTRDLTEMENEARSSAPSKSKIQSALRSIVRMLEGAVSGAAGNLIASGMLARLAEFLPKG